MSVPVLIAGSSQASGPKRGIVINSPALFLIGFENLQSTSFPRAESQAGLMIVRPKSRLTCVHKIQHVVTPFKYMRDVSTRS